MSWARNGLALAAFLTRILRPSARSGHRFPGLTARTGSTPSHPEALVACYVAAWPLPRLVSHQLAVDSFRTHHAVVGRLDRQQDKHQREQ